MTTRRWGRGGFGRSAIRCFSVFGLTLSVSIATFVLLAVRLHQQRPPSWDDRFLEMLGARANPRPLRFVLQIPMEVVGEYRGLVPAGLLVLGLLVRRRISDGLAAAGALGGPLATALVLEPLFRRPALIAGHSGYFPSTHATGSLAAGVILSLLAWPTRWRAPIVAGTLVFVVLYGASLVHSRAHYPSDVVGGWCVALFWASSLALLRHRLGLGFRRRELGRYTERP